MIYILLFLVFMLVGESELAKKNQASDEAEQQIYVYIRGKLALSCLVASVHAMTLWAIGCELWLVFFVLTFSLNFVPNIGMSIAECRKLAPGGDIITCLPCAEGTLWLLAAPKPSRSPWPPHQCLEARALGSITCHSSELVHPGSSLSSFPCLS